LDSPSQIINKNPHNYFTRRSFPLTWLLGIAILNIVFRLASLDHALSWDEAWILCSLKSLASGRELFLHQLWRHPPIYLGLGLLLSPLKHGFDMRMQILSLGLSTAALVVFISFISNLFGRRIALVTGLIYTLLPGTLLFDTWIKRDSLVTLFCTLALWMFFKRKDLLAGIFLGLGFLSKETAVFFALSFIILILLYRPQKQIAKAYLSVFLPAIVVSGWWYLFFHQGLAGLTTFFHGISEEASEFAKPWWYYFAKLQHDLGFAGLLLLGAGILAMLPGKKILHSSRRNLDKFTGLRLLPFIVLLPSYLILSISHGKPPWMTLSLYPYLALLIALGCFFLTRIFLNITPGLAILSRDRITVLIVLILILPLGFRALRFNYIKELENMSPSTVGIMRTSYELTGAVNKLTSENEKLLLMPMIYRIGPTMPDPIFYWHLKPLQLFRNNRLDTQYDEFKRLIIMNKITWALLFPFDGSVQLDIYEKSVQDINSWGYKLSKGVLLRVDTYWQGSKKSG